METDIPKTIILKTAGSNSPGCLTLHFARGGNERRAKSLKPTLPTAHHRIILTLILFSICFFAGCSSNIDKQKFSGIKAAARAMDEAVGDATLSYSRFGELLQKLTDEIARTKAVVSTAEEKSLLNSCEELLAIYQDSYSLWEYKVASSQYGWIPKGRIYMDAKIKTIAVKYQLPAESHVIELTGHHWESISTESIRLIWEKAHGKLKRIRF